MPTKPSPPSASTDTAAPAGARPPVQASGKAAPKKTPKAASSASPRTARQAAPKAAGRPRADEIETRLCELKKAAGLLFLEKGYSHVSLEAIAREARVAVRTIYVKFGGKTGLLGAVLKDKREQFFSNMDMDSDTRPLREVLDDFALRFYRMITSPEAVRLQRMLAAEARSNPELVEAFFAMGPHVTRSSIERFLQRPDIRAQLRDDLPDDQLAVHLTNCILGDQLSRMLLNQRDASPEQGAAELRARMELFYRSVLR